MIILVIALVVFGPKKLPELARLIGKGLGEFRRASNDLRSALDVTNSDAPRRPPNRQSAARSKQIPQTIPHEYSDDEIEMPETASADPVEPSNPTATESQRSASDPGMKIDTSDKQDQ